MCGPRAVWIWCSCDALVCRAGAHLFPTHHTVTLLTWEYLDHLIDEDRTQFPVSKPNSPRAEALNVSSVGKDFGFSLHQLLFINYFLA